LFQYSLDATMYHFVLSLVVIFFFSSQVSCIQQNYYWREYTGSIPKDAIPAGKDINGQNIYVGQAYVKNEGLIVAPIYQGEKEVTAAIKGVKKIERYIKVSLQ
jgi:hypothetical protein